MGLPITRSLGERVALWWSGDAVSAEMKETVTGTLSQSPPPGAGALGGAGGAISNGAENAAALEVLVARLEERLALLEATATETANPLATGVLPWVSVVFCAAVVGWGLATICSSGVSPFFGTVHKHVADLATQNRAETVQLLAEVRHQAFASDLLQMQCHQQCLMGLSLLQRQLQGLGGNIAVAGMAAGVEGVLPAVALAPLLLELGLEGAGHGNDVLLRSPVIGGEALALPVALLEGEGVAAAVRVCDNGELVPQPPLLPLGRPLPALPVLLQQYGSAAEAVMAANPAELVMASRAYIVDAYGAQAALFRLREEARAVSEGLVAPVSALDPKGYTPRGGRNWLEKVVAMHRLIQGVPGSGLILSGLAPILIIGTGRLVGTLVGYALTPALTSYRQHHAFHPSGRGENP